MAMEWSIVISKIVWRGLSKWVFLCFDVANEIANSPSEDEIPISSSLYFNTPPLAT